MTNLLTYPHHKLNQIASITFFIPWGFYHMVNGETCGMVKWRVCINVGDGRASMLGGDHVEV